MMLTHCNGQLYPTLVISDHFPTSSLPSFESLLKSFFTIIKSENITFNVEQAMDLDQDR